MQHVISWQLVHGVYKLYQHLSLGVPELDLSWLLLAIGLEGGGTIAEEKFKLEELGPVVRVGVIEFFLDGFGNPRFCLRVTFARAAG